MKNRIDYRRVIFLAFAIAVSTLNGQAQTSENSMTLVEKFQFKQYEDGTTAGYFTLDGNFTLKNLHRVEQYFIDMSEVTDFAIIDKNEGKSTHTVFIRSNNPEVSKRWINTKMNQGITAQKFEVSWSE